MLGTEKANKILGILTIIFTLSIPIIVMSSFYGMNINMPGRIEAPYTFLGPYTSMIEVIMISLIHFTDVLVFPSLDGFSLNNFDSRVKYVFQVSS
jgi:Mg2+ and Co2+ transporter CorA